MKLMVFAQKYNMYIICEEISFMSAYFAEITFELAD